MDLEPVLGKTKPLGGPYGFRKYLARPSFNWSEITLFREDFVNPLDEGCLSEEIFLW